MKTIVLLSLSNVFMTFAWYVHLKEPLKLDFLWAALCLAAGSRGDSAFGDGGSTAQGERPLRAICAHCRKRVRLGHWALVGAAYFMFRQPLGGGSG